MSTYRANFPVDLHSHSNRSDGADTPQELIDHAVAAGVKILAITDHDIRPPKNILLDDGTSIDAVEYASSKNLILLRGIEVSCETTAEDCHIVCLGCNWDDPWFDSLEQSVVASKLDSYKELVRRLTEDGMPISWEEVLDNQGHPVTEDHVQKKMIFELMGKKGFTRDWSEAKLLIKNTPRYHIDRQKPDPLDVIREAHRTGGIAIMAHPYLVNEPVCLPSGTMSRGEYIDRLIEAGLDGIEASYTYAKTSYGGTLTPEEIEAEVRKLYTGRVSIISGGSDYHADARKGAKKIRETGECGITWEYFMSNPVLRSLLPAEQIS